MFRKNAKSIAIQLGDVDFPEGATLSANAIGGKWMYSSSKPYDKLA